MLPLQQPACHCPAALPAPQRLPLLAVPPLTPTAHASLPPGSRCAPASQLGVDLGRKGVRNLLGTLPSWLNYTETEKVEVSLSCAVLWDCCQVVLCCVVAVRWGGGAQQVGGRGTARWAWGST